MREKQIKLIIIDREDDCISYDSGLEDFIKSTIRNVQFKGFKIIFPDILLDGNEFFRATVYEIFNYVLLKLVALKYIRFNSVCDNLLEFKLYRLLLIKYWVNFINGGSINLESLYKFYTDEEHFEYFYFMLNYYCADAICAQLSPLTNSSIKNFNLKHSKLNKLIERFSVNRICYGVSNFEIMLKRRKKEK